MEFRLPRRNWHMALADAIKQSSDGDIIIVFSKVMLELGLSAKMRMCPDKLLTFEIEKSE